MIHIAEIINTLEELGFVRKEEEKQQLLAMTVPQLMKDYILPQCLCLPRSGVRYPRIDGCFMRLMAKHGQDFLSADYELGSVLLELAMQRITKHPELPAIDYYGILPDAYKPYSAASCNPNGYNGCPDEPGLWGDGEVEFLMERLPTCLALGDARYAEHAKTILFQLLTKLDGKNEGDSHWFGMRCEKTERELWQAAAHMAIKAGLSRVIIDLCVNKGWRCGKQFFAFPWFLGEDEFYLLDQIDLNKEEYFRGLKRGILKLFGLYNKKTREKIMEEIRAAK